MPLMGELRFVERVVTVKAPNGNNVRQSVRILQQYVAKEVPSDQPMEYEWRDVPLVPEM